ncbi:Hypothetical predicted protein [Pelobates cultripes]|uniref:Uncharacterized protein n=1 Tax=Pelobates cultripes TaxID=61616 RepID=A0AAD1SEL4_PELCU|nr:Hypothetical predicted protein [Pelobates cultripes]
MAQSINKALASTMGVMSSSITQSITRALMQSQSSGPQSTQNLGTTNVAQPGRKALAKSKHIASPPELQVQPALTDTPQAVNDGAIPPRNRAPGQAKSADPGSRHVPTRTRPIRTGVWRRSIMIYIWIIMVRNIPILGLK